MFKGLFGSSANGFDFINFENGGFTTIGALLIFIGAVVGLAYAILPMLKIKLPSVDLVKTIAIIVSVTESKKREKFDFNLGKLRVF
nr:MAG TPA: hypothetical protein [Caudoviricetes sp.]